MNKVIKTAAVAVATLAVATSAIVSPLTASAWSDNIQGGRPAYRLDCTDPTKCKIKKVKDNKCYETAGKTCETEGDYLSFAGNNQPFFNSFINNPNYGDERNFVTALPEGADIHGPWNSNELTVEDSKTYTIRAYIHNDNPNGTAAVAKNTRVAFNIPVGSSTGIEVGGYINSDNANATQVFDNVILKSNDNRAFHITYVDGSAMVYDKGNLSGTPLSDDVVKKAASAGGASIGDIAGCFEYTKIVTIKVKVSYDNFTIDKKMRLAGTDDEFVEELDVKVGDKVEFKISYKNALPYHKTNNALNEANIQHNVMIRDILPNNMVYVPNTTRLFNANYQKGTLLSPDGDLFTKAVNIGNYGPQSNGYVFFTAEVVDKSLECGNNALVNWAQATVGNEVHQDRAVAHTTKVCENEPTPEIKLPTAGPVVTLGGAVAAGTIVTAAGYFIMSRRALR